MKMVALANKALAQLPEVKDFAVENDSVSARLVGHGLVAVAGEV
jgi:hypothetical protein